MNTETANLDSILRRCAKLLAIANDDRANPNEAAAAASQAEKIMRKYQLENADVIGKELKAGHAMEYADCSASMKRDAELVNGKHKLRKVPGWASWLAVAVSRLNDCEVKIVWTEKAGVALRFFGYGADVKVATWMYDYLVGKAIGEIRAYQKASPRSKVESESYRRGFILAVCGKLNTAKAEKEAEMAAAVSGRALVLSKRQAIIDAFGDFKYGEAKASSARIVGDAYAQGREAGKKVDINNRGIGSNATGTTRIQ